mmetsp:Transcript_10768/g.14973  ORF Transcript_10768/g.14973 Transcript_10768/m.14973 type:complete len:118 (-) Transcript_10768:123-476(-)|eukprot:CAMPEP_0184481664 /NCGR_PEP_ID=MMETSP0113_2-20130426/3223_1 /TAXON_ID=91329 /ORGANISM="Norrisiella sphaerica, Strain BC52" /LENGTH=117 /DNA_ID=CAMNT_0026860915 /DNA_START=74 /DNA_END=427 /DNA_ORIENTATION=-
MAESKHDPNTATLSSHILDTSMGTPGRGLSMTLFEKTQDGFKKLSSHVTNDDGRVKDFKPLGAGIYKIVFDTDGYYKKLNTECFYPECTVVFRTKLGEHYHVPLLLSPFGYTTYRGS